MGVAFYNGSDGRIKVEGKVMLMKVEELFSNNRYFS
jgi:hypothetical protein